MNQFPNDPALSLRGKVALVTGGGRGIGKAIAERLARAGAAVAIASRKFETLQAAADEFGSLPGRVIPIACHVGRLDQIEALVQQTTSQLGAIDILVNNSATNLGQGPALEVTDEMVSKIMEINVLSAIRLIRLIVPGMISNSRGGSIINIASVGGMRPMTGGLLYSATKAALIMMTRSWAVEFGKHNVRVNAIAPGLIKTDFSEFFWKNETVLKSLEDTQPIPRIGLPEEVGGLALFLASAESSFITGQTFVVDGGATAR
jgi:dehydrogenase/reductase SDR family protein 4